MFNSYIYIMKTYKKKNKKTYKKKNKKTYKKHVRGGGPHDKTPYSRPKVPCKYGANCTRKNPQHFQEFSHPRRFTIYTNDDEIRTFIKDAYESYINGAIFSNFKYGIQFLKEGIYDNVHNTFFFHLLTYIVCNICQLIKEYDTEFLIMMLTRFNEESVDITVKKELLDKTVQDCMTYLGIDYINCIEIANALSNPESEFNKKGCI
jgi:hypothetical protein